MNYTKVKLYNEWYKQQPLATIFKGSEDKLKEDLLRAVNLNNGITLFFINYLKCNNWSKNELNIPPLQETDFARVFEIRTFRGNKYQLWVY